MSFWLLLAAVLVPALSYAALLYLFDVHEREPLWALALLFVAGCVCVPVAGAVERWVDGVVPFLSAMREGDVAATRFGCFLVIAPAEELTKLVLVALLARKRLMDEPVDGVVYAGTLALGFATAEGVLTGKSFGLTTVALRGVLATPAHLCFAALWGAGLGALRYWGRSMLPAALLAVLASLVAHGTYDYLLIVDQGRARGAVVAVFAVSGLATAVLFRVLLRASPYRLVTARAGSCASCGKRHGVRVRFCAGCGALLVPVVEPPLPLGFAATSLGFAAQGVILVSGTVLTARLFGESAPHLWLGALQSPSLRTLCVVGFLALGALATGLCVRAYRGRFPTLEAALSTSLVLLCALLFLALTEPRSLLSALWLVPVSLGVSVLAARATSEPSE